MFSNCSGPLVSTVTSVSSSSFSLCFPDSTKALVLHDPPSEHRKYAIRKPPRKHSMNNSISPRKAISASIREAGVLRQGLGCVQLIQLSSTFGRL